mgnify:FL=1
MSQKGMHFTCIPCLVTESPRFEAQKQPFEGLKAFILQCQTPHFANEELQACTPSVYVASLKQDRISKEAFLY